MDLKEIFAIMEKFEKSGLAEIDVKIGDSELSLKKNSSVQLQQQYALPVQQHAALPPAAHAEPAAKAHKEGVEVITSPIVGTFYRSAAPDTPAFVEVGTKVENGSTLCIIEAMKVMNRLEAEFKLEVVAILVDNGQMVEYGTPILEVKRL